MSRRAADLGRGLNLRLSKRVPRVIYLTDEGRALFAKTSVLLAKLDEATAAIASRGDAHEGGCGY